MADEACLNIGNAQILQPSAYGKMEAMVEKMDHLLGDLHQVVLAGVNVDGAVAHGKHLVAAGGRGANFDAYGPILLGLNAPINDLSRGCNAMEVYSMAIITAALADWRTRSCCPGGS